ncbi:MAG TPA: SWIM zinc finger family protein [Kofleriaceae bacterium]|nr:SWIM zinc finger family protein [Kofleriaceae bacterium]
MSYWSEGYTWAPYKTVAQRRAEAAREIKKAGRRGRARSPVAVASRKIASTFWGKAWCDNLERYRDFAYRLERGRSYLRSGSVIDLQIETGKITAEVLGSSLYQVAIEIDAVPRAAWQAIQRDCAGSIGSRLDLLSGRLSDAVMERLYAERTGLFPAPSAIRFTCSCPDYATMCKHVAAAMYGVGARLDHEPELLFTLRRVALDALLASAVTALPSKPASGRVLAAGGLASLFGIELADPSTKAKPKATPTLTPTPTRRAAPAAKATSSSRAGTKATSSSRAGAKATSSSRAGTKARSLPAPVTRVASKADQPARTRAARGTKAAPSRVRATPPAKPTSPDRRRSRSQ